MVVAFQPILGLGTRLSHPSKLRTSKPGVNLQGHSFTTRFLNGVLPKGIYKDNSERFDNFVVDIFKDFEQLYFQGYNIGGGRVLRFIILGVKGDLPFLSKTGHLTRTFLHIRKGPERPTSKPLTGCCWLCYAGSAHWDFEDLSSEPRWLQTSGKHNPPPWDAVPPFLDYVPHVVEEKASFFTIDVLHIYHLGIGRDYGGSTLVSALAVYDGSTPEEKIEAMNADLAAFLKRSRKQVHFRQLTRELLGFKGTGYPSGHWSKALDTPVLIEFAAFVLQKNKEMYDNSRLFKVLVSGCNAIGQCMRTLLKGSLWLDRDEARTAGRAGLHFLACYQKAADITFADRLLRFNLVPKLHMFHHVALYLVKGSLQRDFTLNPLAQATFQDEDYIGRVSRLSRRVSPRLFVMFENDPALPSGDTCRVGSRPTMKP